MFYIKFDAIGYYILRILIWISFYLPTIALLEQFYYITLVVYADIFIWVQELFFHSKHNVQPNLGLSTTITPSCLML